MPNLIVDLDKLEHNIQFVKAFCEANRLEWVGVVKGCESSVPVIELFQRSGVASLGIASLVTAREQQRHFHEKPMLVAIPSALEAQAVVSYCKSSLNSELETIKALAEAAEREGVTHEVILMIEVGDLREGVMPEDAVRTVRKILELGSKHLELSGIGANLACCSGVLPSSENVSLLNGLAEEIETSLGYPMEKVSIGGSVMLDWMENHSLPPRINQSRPTSRRATGARAPPSEHHAKTSETRRPCFSMAASHSRASSEVQPTFSWWSRASVSRAAGAMSRPSPQMKSRAP